MTFKQALELGAHVRKGEKGSLVVYADTITRTEVGENGQESGAVIPFMKGYTVFNVEQIERLPPQYDAAAQSAKIDAPQRIERAERFFAALARHHPRQNHRVLRAGARPHSDVAVRDRPRH
jgi:antirestriction protein ArdC